MFARELNIKNHYDILHVSQSATTEEIKNAYKKLALKYHPDKASHNNISTETAESLFKEVNTAYEVLSNPNKRKLYDISLNPKKLFSEFHEDYFNYYSKPMQIVVYPVKLSQDIQQLIHLDDTEKLNNHLKEIRSQSLLQTMLYRACQQGKFNVVKYLIEVKKMTPTLIAEDGLHFNGPIFKAAAGSGNLTLVKYLLEVHHVDIESRDLVPHETRDTALSRAIASGNIPIIEYLIKKGANVNTELSCGNVLDVAASYGSLYIVQLLIAAGATVDDFNLSHTLPKGHLEIVKCLLQKRPGLKNHLYTESPACSAIWSGNVDLVKYLEQHESLDILSPYNRGYQTQSESETKSNLLANAGLSGSIEMINYLLDVKGLAKEIDNYKYTLLASAICTDSFYYNSRDVGKLQRLQLIRYLIEERKLMLPNDKLISLIRKDAKNSGIRINAYLQRYLLNPGPLYNLFTAIAKRGLNILSIQELFRLYNLNILKKGKNDDFRLELHCEIDDQKLSNDQLTTLVFESPQFQIDALFYYASYRYRESIEPLKHILQLGININIENDYGTSLLEFAYQQTGYNEIVKLLIEYGADVHKQNKDGKSLYDRLTTNEEFMTQLNQIAQRTNNTGKETMKNRNPLVIKSIEQSTIPIADKPLRLGGRIEYVPVSKFEKKIGRPFIEQVDVGTFTFDSNKIREDITGNLTSTQLKEQLAAILAKPRNDLVICKINDEVGYGVFASNEIPKDTVLCFYSGTLKDGDKSDEQDNCAIQYHGLNASFVTKTHRGIASLFQHLPSVLKFPDAKMFSEILNMFGQSVSNSDLKLNDELYSIEFMDKSAEKSLATENIRREFIYYKGIPVVLFVTNRQINSGEQLGFNYGKGYMLNWHLVPDYFNELGGTISASAYRRTFYQLKLTDCTYTGELLPLIQQLKKGNMQIELINDTHKSIKVDAFIILDELLRVHGITHDEYKALNKQLSIYKFKNSLFGNPEINRLVKKYGLPDDTQASLEKGLRNATVNNNTADLKILIKFVKNINAQDDNPVMRRTALHWATIKDHQNCYQLLLDAGALTTIPDAMGKTAVNYLRSSPVHHV